MRPRSRVQDGVESAHEHTGHTGITRHSPRNDFNGYFVLSPVLRYRMHTSDSIFSVGSTKNVSHQSHLTRLWQHLMAQAGSPANPLKKNLVSRCVHIVGSSRAMT